MDAAGAGVPAESLAAGFVVEAVDAGTPADAAGADVPLEIAVVEALADASGGGALAGAVVAGCPVVAKVAGVTCRECGGAPSPISSMHSSAVPTRRTARTLANQRLARPGAAVVVSLVPAFPVTAPSTPGIRLSTLIELGS
ncbi:MAG: hypothetical protein ACREPH_02215 [Rhodanobacteraceae bacterium]